MTAKELFTAFTLITLIAPSASAGIGVGAKPIDGAEVIIDGTRKMLDEKWIYWEGPKSGIDGGNDGGKGITDTSGGLKLQCEGHDVRYRNTWIKELDLKDADTDFAATE